MIVLLVALAVLVAIVAVLIHVSGALLIVVLVFGGAFVYQAKYGSFRRRK